ncbi:ABC transporter ATP-binding protein [Terribacillus sp. DMT04]|uniref:ABC transporter ATP-binding protein n=1 Tax=Terribacillus sp. DMT04 TaxID=2850441 RepID=UPI001C2BB450|nr:ABC transporter ATP-binding protein [Terribacillus sp. DMT04]QXE02647.1 ABC transporter ATP-binding protein [Terribacillus sp. DMT04]
MIQLDHVHKQYGGRKAVNDIHLTVPSGKIFGFLGPNGAGKSTTIKMVTGILPIDSGTITINGKDISTDTIAAKHEFGYVPDSPDLFLRLNGIDYLHFIGDIYGIPADERTARIEEYAKMFSIYEALSDQIKTYSHGMRQKLFITGMLVQQPSVWILDEPMTGLDPKSSYQLKELMRQHTAKGNTVFFSSHVLEVVEQLCDEVAIIRKGEMLFHGTLPEMREKFHSDESLEHIFLELTQDA